MEKYLRPIKDESLTEKAASALKKYIIAEKLKEGDKIYTERKLSDMLMVSRNVIREALKSLESTGIVYKKHGRGIFVDAFRNNLTAESVLFGLDKLSIDLNEILEVRKSFEITILKLLINKIQEKDIEELQEIVNKIWGEKDKTGSNVKDDLSFHIKLLKIIKNDVIEKFGCIMVEFFRELVLARPEIIIIEDKGKYSKENHQKIINALKEKDLDKAIKYMIKHFDAYKMLMNVKE